MATRRTFFSFHYKPDNWRAAQVRNIGVVEGNSPVSDNDWETVTRGGDTAIRKWIDGQMRGTSCTIVLIGSHTADRKWINYEIKKAWSDGKGVMGIYIHNLQNISGNQSSKGDNPFDYVTADGMKLSNVVKAHNPPYFMSANVYNHIKENIASWVEGAILIRQRY